MRFNKLIITFFIFLIITLLGLFSLKEKIFNIKAKQEIKQSRNIGYIFKQYSVQGNGTTTLKNWYPQIINYPDAKKMDEVNLIIRKTFNDDPATTTVPVYTSDSDSMYGEINVTYAKDDIFSYRLTGETNGGAYPSTYDQGHTYDLKTGKEVGFLDLFRDWDSQNSDRFSEYGRDDQVVEAVYGDMIKKSEEAFSKIPTSKRWPNNQDGDACTYVHTLEGKKDFGDFLDTQFFLQSDDPTHVVFKEDLPHVIAACEDQEIVDIGRLLPVLKQDSILNRLYQIYHK